MSKFIYSNILKDKAWKTEILTLDLPVNPLSFIAITLSVFNVSDEVTEAEILAFLNKVSITHEGVNIFTMESEDIVANMVFNGIGAPVLTNNIATDNAVRELTLIVPFGRAMFSSTECFPKTTRGEFQLTLDCTEPGTSCDNGYINVECCELPEATPESFLRGTLISVAAPGAAGDNDIDLPIGYPITKLIMMSTTIPTTASHSWGIQDVRVLLNNSEYGYVSAKSKVLRGLSALYGMGKTHDIAAYGSMIAKNYFVLDYDLWTNGQYLLETAGASSLKARLNMSTSEAAKIIVNQLVPASVITEQ